MLYTILFILQKAKHLPKLIMPIPKQIGKRKRRLVLEESDEEENKMQAKAIKRASALEEYYTQLDTQSKSTTSRGVSGSSVIGSSGDGNCNGNGNSNGGGGGRDGNRNEPKKQGLLPTPVLSVYHLKIEDFDIKDIVVQV